LYVDELGQEKIGQRSGQIAMCNRAAKRALPGLFDIDMKVPGRIGEEVDSSLVDLEPIGFAEIFPDAVEQFVRCLEYPHARS